MFKFVNVFTRCDYNAMNAVAECHPKEKQAYKDIMLGPLHIHYSTDLASYDLWFFFQVKITFADKQLESIQDIQAATTVLFKCPAGV